MLRESTSRQPCSAFSCIEVTRKRPSGEKVASRCEPFHSSRSARRRRSETRASRRCNGRAPGESPWAGSRARARCVGALQDLTAPAASRARTCLPAVHAISLAAHRHRVDPAALLVGDLQRLAVGAVVATTRPSSPPVISLLPSRSRDQHRRVGVGDDAPSARPARRSAATPSASASAGSPSTNAAATTCAPASNSATCWVSEALFIGHGAPPRWRSSRAGQESLADFRLRRDRGR